MVQVPSLARLARHVRHSFRQVGEVGFTGGEMPGLRVAQHMLGKFQARLAQAFIDGTKASLGLSVQ